MYPYKYCHTIPQMKKKTFWEKLYIPPRNKVEISFHCMWKCQEIEYKTRHTRENKSTNILTFFNHFIVIYFLFLDRIYELENINSCFSLDVLPKIQWHTRTDDCEVCEKFRG